MGKLWLASLLPTVAALSFKPMFNPLDPSIRWQYSIMLAGGDDPMSGSECRIGEDEPCNIHTLISREPTRIFPGGMSECISPQNREYSFQVVPRNLEKVLIFFEGGGACWDERSTMIGACKNTDSPFKRLHGLVGSGQSELNPFHDYTVVFINACTGDLHSGNVSEHNYLFQGKPFKQRGYYNTMTVLDWTKSMFNQNEISNLIIMGESAGAIATQVWAAKMLNELKYKSASVIADSYVGVFPPGFQGPVFKSLGVCDTGVLDWNRELAAKCRARTITIADCYEATIRAFPRVHFGSLLTKFDSEQIRYGNMAALSFGSPPNMTPAQFRKDLSSTLERYKDFPNHAVFLSSMSLHVYSRVIFEAPGPIVNTLWANDHFGPVQQELSTFLRHFDTHDGAKSRCQVLKHRDFVKLYKKKAGTEEDYCTPVEGEIF